MQVRGDAGGVAGASLSTDGGLDLRLPGAPPPPPPPRPSRKLLGHDRAVTMSKPTANWEKVGDKFYRKTQLYAAVFDQDLELENYNVVGAPYSGAVGRYAARRRDAVHGTVA